MEYKATSIEELNRLSQGVVVELPPFTDGMTLRVRMRRPSILTMLSTGKIPNPLVSTAVSLFNRGGSGVDTKDPTQVKDLVGLFHVFCEASFVEPTYQQIKEAGLELTDDQLVFVSNFVQAGTKALHTFRGKPQGARPHFNVPKVQKNSGRAPIDR